MSNSQATSKKRKLLRRNLKRLIERIEKGIVPLRIVEVLAFGSFLRIKATPGDIDLIIFYKEDLAFDKQIKEFQQFINEKSRDERGCELLENLSTNQSLATEFAKENFPRLPANVWLRHIKVTGPMKIYTPYGFNKIEITRKVLKENMRYIQIAKIENIDDKDDVLSNMSSQTFKLIWSNSMRDLDENLKDLQDVQLNATISEMKNFLIQVERYKSYYYVLLNVLKKVIDTIKIEKVIPDTEKLIKYAKEYGMNRGILEPYLDWVMNQIKPTRYVDEPNLKEHVTDLDIDKNIEDFKNSVSNFYELGDLCESMRKEINIFRDKCTVAKNLLEQLLYPPNKNGFPPIERKIDISAFWSFLSVPMYQAKDEIKREVLSDLSLNDINRRIILVERLGSRSDYRLADTDEEIKKFTELSKIGKTEKEHAKYIRPILRKAFPNNIKTFVFFTTHIRENGVAIPEKVQLSATYQGKEIEEFLNIINKMGFKVGYRYSNFCNAYLDINISHLNGDKKEIKKLVKNKLDALNENSTNN